MIIINALRKLGMTWLPQDIFLHAFPRTQEMPANNAINVGACFDSPLGVQALEEVDQFGVERDCNTRFSLGLHLL